MTEEELGMGAEKPLHLVVASQKVKVEAAVDILEYQPALQADPGFEEIVSQAADSGSAVKMRFSLGKLRGFDRLTHPVASGLG